MPDILVLEHSFKENIQIFSNGYKISYLQCRFRIGVAGFDYTYCVLICMFPVHKMECECEERISDGLNLTQGSILYTYTNILVHISS